jgi:hypothetical protein
MAFAAGMRKVISAQRWCSLRWLMTGSMAGPPFKSRLICGVRRHFTGRVDLELGIGCGVVAAMARIGDTVIEDVPDEYLRLGNDGAERVPIKTKNMPSGLRSKSGKPPRAQPLVGPNLTPSINHGNSISQKRLESRRNFDRRRWRCSI